MGSRRAIAPTSAEAGCVWGAAPAYNGYRIVFGERMETHG